MIQQLVRKTLREMNPYSPIEPPDQIARRLGLAEERIIKLDANENPYGVSPAVLKKLGKAKYLHIYPDPAQVALRESIAKYNQCNPDRIVVGTGADELIDLICRLVLEPGDQVLTFVPTFAYYSHVVEMNAGKFIGIEREKDFSISMEKVRRIDLSGVKVVFLCSPNNPSGNMLEEEILQYFLDKNLIVVVDEAYFEFSGKSYQALIEENENLVVLRTFSKCFALAGLRVGYGMMGEYLAQQIMKVKPPFSVSTAAEIALIECLRELPHFQRQVKDIIATRERSLAALREFSKLEVFSSESNFILCKVLEGDAKSIKQRLENKGILIRYFDTSLLNNFIRISVGTDSQMDILLRELKGILETEISLLR